MLGASPRRRVVGGHRLIFRHVRCLSTSALAQGARIGSVFYKFQGSALMPVYTGGTSFFPSPQKLNDLERKPSVSSFWLVRRNHGHTEGPTTFLRATGCAGGRELPTSFGKLVKGERASVFLPFLCLAPLPCQLPSQWERRCPPLPEVTRPCILGHPSGTPALAAPHRLSSVAAMLRSLERSLCHTGFFFFFKDKPIDDTMTNETVRVRAV